ncbi:MAG: hypothetical protein COY40_01990 [Alphaproteobacteria bacterium CG_4_10_14_0_8_um_filter_53_9]|nr:MAG: hypothetical protein COY40_01990 [Alphaproteobacteria bacterium CG_4_10_14_0_8_um_filter_53_9]
MKIYLLTLMSLFTSMGAYAQQADFPAAIPFTADEDKAPSISPTALAPVSPYQVSYTVTLQGEAITPNPREKALAMAAKEGLKMVLQNQTPVVEEAEITRLSEDKDPARFLKTYKIEEEILTPEYKLTVLLTYNDKTIARALHASPDETSNLPQNTQTLTLRLTQPTAARLGTLQRDIRRQVGTSVFITSLSKQAATLAVTTPDAESFITKLKGTGYSPEAVGSTYWLD